jgi:hypothetical protein
MNDNDKAGRYLVKRDSAGFFHYLLGNPRVSFRAWIDARRVALPDQHDLTNDLVAVLESNGVLEAVCLELEAEARADAVTRSLEYQTRLWMEPAGPGSLKVSCVFGAVLDLTGRSPTREFSLRSELAPGCGLKLTVLRRHLADDKAANLVADVTAGTVSPWLLPWVPLMAGGGESAIIGRWLDEAERRFTKARDQADVGSLTRVFAALAGCRPAWDLALRGWNMKTSPIFDEVRAESREEGRAEGERRILLRQGRQKFGKAPTKKQRKTLEAISDLAQLESLAGRLLDVNSWGELLYEG